MNLVGAHGKGESVWLAFFLVHVLTRFAEVARARNDVPFAERCLREAARLRGSIEQSGWDGNWYLRAYFDDGASLGSASNAECRIDSIVQSWSVLAGIDNAERSRKAMDAVDEHLVRRDAALVQLLDPPFDLSTADPGYIQGYIPGVRENGGQYTHAAIWVAMAYAAMGDNRRAWEILTLTNPIHHTDSAEGAAIYKVEPYVAAADVYASSPHTGRGGWTWYTGSAGWMYRLIVESLLGLRREVDRLRVVPCLPADWGAFKVHYRYRETVYHIVLEPMHDGTHEASVEVDGVVQPDQTIPLVDDRREHWVKVGVVTAVSALSKQ